MGLYSIQTVSTDCSFKGYTEETGPYRRRHACQSNWNSCGNSLLSGCLPGYWYRISDATVLHFTSPLPFKSVSCGSILSVERQYAMLFYVVRWFLSHVLNTILACWVLLKHLAISALDDTGTIRVSPSPVFLYFAWNWIWATYMKRQLWMRQTRNRLWGSLSQKTQTR